MGSGTCWKPDSDLKNLDAGQGSLLKILVLDTVQALGSKRTAPLRTWLSFVEISWHLIAESQGYHWREIIHWHCCNRSTPSGCSSSSFDLFYLTFFLGSSGSPLPPRAAAGAQHTSRARSSISAHAGAEGAPATIDNPDLGGTRVPGLFCCHLFGHRHLVCPKMCQSLVWVRYTTYAVSRGHWWYYTWMRRGRGETAGSAKRVEISL